MPQPHGPTQAGPMGQLRPSNSFVSFISHSRWPFVSVITGSINCVPSVVPSTSTSQMPLAWCVSLHVVIECVMILPILFCIIAFIFVVLVSSNTSHISDSFSIEFREWRLCILIEGRVASFVLERSIRVPHLMHTQVVPYWLLRCRCTAAEGGCVVPLGLQLGWPVPSWHPCFVCTVRVPYRTVYFCCRQSVV